MSARHRAASRVTRLARPASISTPIGPADEPTRQRQSPPRDRVQARAVGAGRDLVIPAAIPANRLEMSEAERVAFIRSARGIPTADELAARDERPSQTCPDCGRDEAAHWYCSGCFLPMGPADWIANPSRKSQGESGGARVHAMAEIAAAGLGGAKPGLLAGTAEPLSLGF